MDTFITDTIGDRKRDARYTLYMKIPCVPTTYEQNQMPNIERGYRPFLDSFFVLSNITPEGEISEDQYYNSLDKLMERFAELEFPMTSLSHLPESKKIPRGERSDIVDFITEVERQSVLPQLEQAYRTYSQKKFGPKPAQKSLLDSQKSA